MEELCSPQIQSSLRLCLNSHITYGQMYWWRYTLPMDHFQSRAWKELHIKRKVWSLTHVQFALIWCWAASRPKWRIWHWSDSIITRLYFNYYHNPEWKHILNKVLLKSLLMPVSVEINHKTIKMLIQLIKPLTKSTLKYSASIPKSLWHTTNLIVNHQLEATYLLL